MNGRAGFSLAEIVVGLLLLSVFAVVLLGVVPSAIFGIRSENHRLVAVTIAHRVVEEVNARGFEQLQTGDYQLAPETHQKIVYQTVYSLKESGLKGDPQIYESTRSWQTATTTYRLDVEVNWTERNHRCVHKITTLVGRT